MRYVVMPKDVSRPLVGPYRVIDTKKDRQVGGSYDSAILANLRANRLNRDGEHHGES